MNMLTKMRPDRLKMHQKMVETFGPALPLAYCLKWTKFGKLFLRKLIKIDATRCLDFSSKCIKMRLAAGLRPDPLGELERSPSSPRPPSRKKGPYF